MGSHVHSHTLSRFCARLASEGGKGTIFKIVVLLVVAAGVYFAVLVVPAYIESFKFKDELKTMAQHAHVEKEDGVLLASIQKEANNLGINVMGNNIQIHRDPENRWVEITASYDRPVVLKPFDASFNLHFESYAHEKF